MSDLSLKGLDINNFRSIRGHIYAPLDAKVVLVHGENGAGKTSLLSAIELALTGRVQSLERADPDYVKQLLHRSATEGSVLLHAFEEVTERAFKADLTAAGAQSIAALDNRRAAIFRERAFLPQSLLGQLLQIYQDAGNDAASPLARFVANLLGLDQLDALEAGLKPLSDVRNVRKTVEGWQTAENERSRIDRLLSEQKRMRGELNEQIRLVFGELSTVCSTLGISVFLAEDTLHEVTVALSDGKDAEAFARLADQQRKLSSIQREIEAAQRAIKVEEAIPSAAEESKKAFERWESVHGVRVSTLRGRFEALVADITLPSEPEQFAQAAMASLGAETKLLSERTMQARADISRHVLAQEERDVALRQRAVIDEEVSRLSSDAGSLGSALAELTAFISDDTCPVCERNFGEVSDTPLSEHVHNKVRRLSSSAERLLVLGRSRSEVQVTVERLNREIEAIAARKVDEQILADLDRRRALLVTLNDELGGITDALREGGRLRAAEVAARRAVSAARAHHVSLAAARDTLSDFAVSVAAPPIDDGESFEAAAARLKGLLASEAARLEERIALRRRGADHIAAIRSAIVRRKNVEERIAADSAAQEQTEHALSRAQGLRDQGNAIRAAVDKVRSSIIRREFNDRLNRVWRDLFVRLAPQEPFVPAFRIPESSTQRLQPKLITAHRDGGDTGGTPGAMLSAGNLNTAALTLFIALHLSVPREVPCLILDDPVQSMDDVHIAQFAALLRTLSKEHGRQIVIAVHDRQLFEYLKLELSPAFPDDSLVTLELSRGSRRDSVCISSRFTFRQETAVLAAA